MYSCVFLTQSGRYVCRPHKALNPLRFRVVRFRVDQLHHCFKLHLTLGQNMTITHTNEVTQQPNMQHPQVHTIFASSGAPVSLGTSYASCDMVTSPFLVTWIHCCRSESEKNRRRDLLYELRNRREQMQYSIKRSAGTSGR